MKLNRAFSCRDARAVIGALLNRPPQQSKTHLQGNHEPDQGGCEVLGTRLVSVLGNATTASNSKTDSTSTEVGNDTDEEGYDNPASLRCEQRGVHHRSVQELPHRDCRCEEGPANCGILNLLGRVARPLQQVPVNIGYRSQGTDRLPSTFYPVCLLLIR